MILHMVRQWLKQSMNRRLYSQKTLTGELWGVYCGDFRENLLHHNGTALYLRKWWWHISSFYSFYQVIPGSVSPQLVQEWLKIEYFSNFISFPLQGPKERPGGAAYPWRQYIQGGERFQGRCAIRGYRCRWESKSKLSWTDRYKILHMTQQLCEICLWCVWIRKTGRSPLVPYGYDFGVQTGILTFFLCDVFGIIMIKQNFRRFWITLSW